MQKVKVTEIEISKNSYNKSAILPSRLKTIFLSEIPDELCDKVKLLIQEKRARNISDMINQKMFAIIDKSLEYKCITPTQHKKFIKKFNLI